MQPKNGSYGRSGDSFAQQWNPAGLYQLLSMMMILETNYQVQITATKVTICLQNRIISQLSLARVLCIAQNTTNYNAAIILSPKL